MLFGKYLEKQHDFDNANEMFSKAIRLCPENWFAYKLRMSSLKMEYAEQFKEASETNDYSGLDHSLLEKAKEDGEKCCNMNASGHNLLEYGRVLSKLARCPKAYKGRQPNEVDFETTREAIDVFSRIDPDHSVQEMSIVFKELSVTITSMKWKRLCYTWS